MKYLGLLPVLLTCFFNLGECGLSLTKSAVKSSGGANFFTTVKPPPSREERFYKLLDTFDNNINKLEVDHLLNGPNLELFINKTDGSKTPLEFLSKRGNKGINLIIENYSNRYFADPQVWTRCGYQDEDYGTLHSINPGTSEIALLHNYKKLRSSCGAITWQIMENPAKPLKTSSGKGIRMYLTWSNLDTVGSNRCAADKNNEYVISFMKVDLDDSGHSDTSKKSIKKLYEKYHNDDYISYLTFPLKNSSAVPLGGPSLAAFAESPDGQLEIRADFAPGCTSNLTIQIYGKHKAKLSRADLGLEEPFYSDHVWEQMIRQSWRDIVNTINRDKGLYGIGLKPLVVDKLMTDPIYINTSVLGYELDFWMWNVTVDGLTNIVLEEMNLERGDSLKNLRTLATLGMGNLTVAGMYKYTAKYTGWMWGMTDMDSEGEQPFKVDLVNAKFNIKLGMETVNGCGRNSDLIIDLIELPIDYDGIQLDFTNIGSVLGGVIDIIGNIALEMSKTTIVDVIKSTVKGEVDTLLCENFNVTQIDRLTMDEVTISHPRWKELVSNASSGWGLKTLRRDLLAEKFIKKVFDDGVVKHLSNPADPVSKALDPFQLLPASEDFRKRGIVKGHAVVCELYLFGLSKMKLLDMRLVRNEDLSYSGLWVRIGLPTTEIHGSYRLNNVRVMSVIPAPISQGNITVGLTDVTVDLMVVLRANPDRDLSKSANITRELFEVDFGHKTAKFKINGLAKGLNTVSNKLTNLLGSWVLKKQKALLNTEIYNIINGFAECLMYKPGMGVTECMDRFWESLGFKVPFEFPSCQELYKIADGVKVQSGA